LRSLRITLFICFLVSLTMFGYNSEEKVVNAKSSDTTTNPPITVEVDLQFIKEKLVSGLTTERVEALLGSKFVQVTSAMDGSKVWRYDFGTKEDYQFEGFLDEVDLVGLKGEALNIQLFISWNEDEAVEHISAYYVSESDNLLHEYKMFASGEIEDIAIE
jgi:hypothetical protein